MAALVIQPKITAPSPRHGTALARTHQEHQERVEAEG